MAMDTWHNVLNEPPGTAQGPLACSSEHGAKASGFTFFIC